jgi:O-succinylbenzoic acid--CoA ligase
MAVILFNSKSYSFETIRVHGSGLLGESEQVFRPAFELAQQWLNGNPTFTFYTSGSTGTPKKIELQREQLLASAEGTINALRLSSTDHLLVCMNTKYIGGAMLLIRGLLLNATITLLEPSGDPLQEIPVNHPYSFVSFAPVQLFPVLANPRAEKQKLARFKNILVGGAALDLQLESELAGIPTRIYHTYGMTETVSHIALRQIGHESFYTVLNGVEIQADSRDCLMIRSASTQHEWILTNDVVTLLSDATFKLSGRIDDVINSGGIKIWPSVIEQAILECSGNRITGAFVTGIPDTKLGQQTIAVLETEQDAVSLQRLLDRDLPQRLGKYEIPKQFYFLGRFVYTATGKINKAETLKMIGLQ